MKITKKRVSMRRRMFSAGLLAAAVAMALAGTAYACVVMKGDATVDGVYEDTNLLTGNESHGFCTGRAPTKAARGGSGSSVGITVAAATACNASGTNVLPGGDYEVRFRHAKAWTGSDGVSWAQVSGSGCFRYSVDSTTNWSLGTLSVASNGSGSGSWNLPTGLTSNAIGEASIICIARRGTTTNNTGDGSGSNPGFLAPFRVATS